MKFPLIVSFKLDGIRCEFKDGEMLTSSLKMFSNVQIVKRFQHLALLSAEKNIIIDGELRAKSLVFNDLSGLIRSDDAPIPDDLMFYCFDVVRNEKYDTEFTQRVEDSKIVAPLPFSKVIEQVLMEDPKDIPEMFKRALADHCDGLILRNPKGRYKCGRGTVKEALIYKLKPYRTFDAKITGIIQATEVREGAEKKINELGRSVTSKKKGDRVLIEKASAFVVMYEGKELKVTIAMTDIEKEEIWKNKEKYLGRWVEYKGMLVGSKDVPRHPTTIRFRDDKED
jgi:ATP-dependent DNA ligase